MGNFTKNIARKPLKTTDSEKAKDDNAITLIQGLDLLIAYARTTGLGNAARMIHSAKESLVYWAAHEDFYESKEDRFINTHMTAAAAPLFERIMQNNPGNAKRTQGELLRNLHDITDNSAASA